MEVLMKKNLLSLLLVTSLSVQAFAPATTLFDWSSGPQWFGVASTLMKDVKQPTFAGIKNLNEYVSSLGSSVMRNPWIIGAAASSINAFKKAPSVLSPFYNNYQGTLAGSLMGGAIAASIFAPAGFQYQSGANNQKLANSFLAPLIVGSFIGGFLGSRHLHSSVPVVSTGFLGLFLGISAYESMKNVAVHAKYYDQLSSKSKELEEELEKKRDETSLLKLSKSSLELQLKQKQASQ